MLYSVKLQCKHNYEQLLEVMEFQLSYFKS